MSRSGGCRLQASVHLRRLTLPIHESDVCIIGSGISATLTAQVLSERLPGLSIIVVEAGRRFLNQDERRRWRERAIDYGENPYPGDVVEDQDARGIISRTQAVGGLGIHFGGVMQRFSQEDLRLKSLYGLPTTGRSRGTSSNAITARPRSALAWPATPGPTPKTHDRSRTRCRQWS